VSPWAENTGEGWRVPGYLLGLGVDLLTAHRLEWFDGAQVTLACEHSGRERLLDAAHLVLVGQRAPVDALYHTLRDAGPLPFTLARIGDAEAPAIIAAATYAGHRYAQELDGVLDIDLPMRHEKIDVGAVLPHSHPGAAP
jgi:dimethylamine/trimethylamine dehydrogenase